MISLLAQAAPALDSINPIGVVEDAAKNVPGFEALMIRGPVPK